MILFKSVLSLAFLPLGLCSEATFSQEATTTTNIGILLPTVQDYNLPGPVETLKVLPRSTQAKFYGMFMLTVTTA